MSVNLLLIHCQFLQCKVIIRTTTNMVQYRYKTVSSIFRSCWPNCFIQRFKMSTKRGIEGDLSRLDYSTSSYKTNRRSTNRSYQCDATSIAEIEEFYNREELNADYWEDFTEFEADYANTASSSSNSNYVTNKTTVGNNGKGSFVALYTLIEITFSLLYNNNTCRLNILVRYNRTCGHNLSALR